MGSLAERPSTSRHAFWNPTNSSQPRPREEDAINELRWKSTIASFSFSLAQLMAIDLRFVLAVSRINNDLERIGISLNIAQELCASFATARKALRRSAAHEQLTEEMVRNALNAVAAATSNSRRPPRHDDRWTTTAIRFP